MKFELKEKPAEERCPYCHDGIVECSKCSAKYHTECGHAAGKSCVTCKTPLEGLVEKTVYVAKKFTLKHFNKFLVTMLAGASLIGSSRAIDQYVAYRDYESSKEAVSSLIEGNKYTEAGILLADYRKEETLELKDQIPLEVRLTKRESLWNTRNEEIKINRAKKDLEVRLSKLKKYTINQNYDALEKVISELSKTVDEDDLKRYKAIAFQSAASKLAENRSENLRVILSEKNKVGELLAGIDELSKTKDLEKDLINLISVFTLKYPKHEKVKDLKEKQLGAYLSVSVNYFQRTAKYDEVESFVSEFSKWLKNQDEDLTETANFNNFYTYGTEYALAHMKNHFPTPEVGQKRYHKSGQGLEIIAIEGNILQVRMLSMQITAPIHVSDLRDYSDLKESVKEMSFSHLSPDFVYDLMENYTGESQRKFAKLFQEKYPDDSRVGEVSQSLFENYMTEAKERLEKKESPLEVLVEFNDWLKNQKEITVGKTRENDINFLALYRLTNNYDSGEVTGVELGATVTVNGQEGIVEGIIGDKAQVYLTAFKKSHFVNLSNIDNIGGDAQVKQAGKQLFDTYMTLQNTVELPVQAEQE